MLIVPTATIAVPSWRKAAPMKRPIERRKESMEMMFKGEKASVGMCGLRSLEKVRVWAMWCRVPVLFLNGVGSDPPALSKTPRSRLVLFAELVFSLLAGAAGGAPFSPLCFIS